jgi:PIN domain nuclease of toxin-antitoxin system
MLLLDTCALLWMVNRDPLRPEALKSIKRAAVTGEIYLSPVSAWEIGLLVKRGRLQLEIAVETYVQKAFSLPGVRIAPLTPEIAARSSHLPGELHDDPADRMLVSTAIVMGFKLVTRDKRLLDYGAQGFLPVMPC